MATREPSTVPPAAAAARDWSELPLDALSVVLAKVGAVDVLMGAGLVCRSWLDAAMVPQVWRVVDMEHPKLVTRKNRFVLRAMAKVAVDRSDEQLEVFAGKYFVDGHLLNYIIKRSPSLKDLRLVSCDRISEKTLFHAILKSPLPELRNLKLYDIDLSFKYLVGIIQSCPALELLLMCECFVPEDAGKVYALEAKISGTKLKLIGSSNILDFESG